MISDLACLWTQQSMIQAKFVTVLKEMFTINNLQLLDDYFVILYVMDLTEHKQTN